MIESASGVFARGREREKEEACSEQEKERLERKVGQLAVEVDWLKKVQGAGDQSMRKKMVERKGCPISIRRQCELLGVNRNRLEVRKPRGLGAEDLAIARHIDELNLRFPEFGARRMSKALERFGIYLGRSGVGRIMEWMGLEAIYRKPRTSLWAPGRPKCPYLLREHVVTQPDEAWCADVTYIPMARGFAYLVVGMDSHTRAVLSWRLWNTLDGAFCVEAFYAAVQLAGKAPEIFNTDQGCQFTSKAWLEAVEGSGAKVSMDGKGRWMDNMFVERTLAIGEARGSLPVGTRDGARARKGFSHMVLGLQPVETASVT